MSAASDFDFLTGEWTIRNRRLRNPLSGSDTWYEFPGRSSIRQAWAGAGNIDEYAGASPDGEIHGLTVRLFDPASRQWRIYWANSANGQFDPSPMTGTFSEGRGLFYNHEQFGGRSIFVRFAWSTQSPDACRWEQAFSADGGATWEVNWIMEFSRITS